jgi:methionine-rich copper-binding protein CopC
MKTSSKVVLTILILFALGFYYFNKTETTMTTLKEEPKKVLANKTESQAKSPEALANDPIELLPASNANSLSSDVYKPPVLTDTDPYINAAHVLVNKTITVAFDENIQAGSCFKNVTLKDSSNKEVKTSKSIIGNRLIIKPLIQMKFGIQYTVSVPGLAIRDLSGNERAVSYSFKFTTQRSTDIKAPVLTDTDPIINATGVPINKAITIFFSENIQAGSGLNNVILRDSANIEVRVSRNIRGNALTLKPNTSLKNGVTYTVVVPGFAVKDSAVNTREASYSFNFTTKNK